MEISLISLEYMLDGERYTQKEVAEYLQNIVVPIPPEIANKVGKFFEQPLRRGPKAKGEKSQVTKHMIIDEFYQRCYTAKKGDTRQMIAGAVCKNFQIPIRYFDDFLAEFNRDVFGLYQLIIDKGWTEKQAISFLIERKGLSEKDILKIIKKYSTD